MSVVGLSHPRAITSILDPVHGTIELTLFDRDIVDSRSFQRLHFVLQQSVNYVAFPANKNTRFPHSIGTAHLVGRLFSKALSNSETPILRNFLKVSGDFLASLIEYLEPTPKGVRKPAEASKKTSLDRLRLAHGSTISGMSRFLHTPLSIDSLRQTEVEQAHDKSSTPFWRVDSTEKVDTGKTLSAVFIIDTYWQALRIYALAHDIGHLPMSHAFENAIDRVARGIAEHSASTDKNEKFGALLDETKNEFFGLEGDHGVNAFFDLLKKELELDRDPLTELVKTKHLHEVRGYAILNKMLTNGSDVSKNFLHIQDSSADPDEVDKVAIDTYCKLIHNLALCIIYSIGLVGNSKKKGEISKYSFLYALRQLVDGTIDGDRLDYTLRDCKEAGVRFGDFDLESIVGNALLVSRDKKNEDEAEQNLFAFGFGPRAVPGIEQFFEARYQSYKYLVHHRTASRSNIAVEALIEKLFVFSALESDSECAAILERYKYVERERSRAKELRRILPVMMDNIEQIDDCSLRTLLHEVSRSFDDEKIAELIAERNPIVSLAKEIRTLSEVVLFRELHHIVTLFKFETLESVFEGQLKLVDERRNKEGLTERDRFIIHVDQNLGELIATIRKKLAEKYRSEDSLNEGHPITLMFENVRSKVFEASDPKREPFEKSVWIRDPRGILMPLEDQRISAGLMAMSAAHKSEKRIRLYASSHELKTKVEVVAKIESLIVECLQAELDKYRTQTSHKAASQ